MASGKLEIIQSSYLSLIIIPKKRQDVAKFLSTGEENKGLFKEGKMEMSAFYVEGDRKGTLGI
jgi:hypothetical protein